MSTLAFLTINKTHTNIKLDSAISVEQRKLLITFVKSKNGSFLDESYQEFIIPRILKQDHTQKLFNYYNINITIIGANTESIEKKTRADELEKIYENIKNSYKLPFGEFKGMRIGELPKYYLKYLIKYHSERKLVEMCKKELENRSIIVFS